MTEFVSIILPVHNGERFIRIAIESVTNQSYTNFELIIVNDCSNDNTKSIIESFCTQDKRIACIENKMRLGVARSLNAGIKQSKGSIIARIDADDIWFKSKLELQVNSFKLDADLMLVGTRKILIDEYGHDIQQTEEFKYYTDYEIKKNIHKANLFNHSSVAFRKDVVKLLGDYNVCYKNSEDYEYWLRMVSKVKVKILPVPLVKYRMHNSSVTSQKLKQQMYYSIRARVAYISAYGLRGFFTKLFLREVAFLVLPASIIKIIRSYKNRKTHYSNG